MGGHDKGDQNFGLIQRGDHDGPRNSSVDAHCCRFGRYGRAPDAVLLQLLMAQASPSTPITVTADQIRLLDLSPLAPWMALGASELLQAGACLQLDLHWPRAEEDPRELSEIPEVRLWSLRADATCPWLPLVLERSSGHLARHVAMLLPHSFSRSEGLRFAPEALELWMTDRLCSAGHWARAHDLNCRANLGQIAAVLGYELDPSFWQALS
mgnify:CR=1 FL=1